MVFNATFNNMSVISWWSVLLLEETGIYQVKTIIDNKEKLSTLGTQDTGQKKKQNKKHNTEN